MKQEIVADGRAKTEIKNIQKLMTGENGRIVEVLSRFLTAEQLE